MLSSFSIFESRLFHSFVVKAKKEFLKTSDFVQIKEIFWES